MFLDMIKHTFVVIAGVDVELTPYPKQIWNLHKILLQNHIGFDIIRASPAKKENV